MKKTIYICDNCGQELTKKHLSLNFCGYSGWVENLGGNWQHTKKIWGIYQFCNEKCLAKFLGVLRITALVWFHKKQERN